MEIIEGGEEEQIVLPVGWRELPPDEFDSLVFGLALMRVLNCVTSGERKHTHPHLYFLSLNMTELDLNISKIPHVPAQVPITVFYSF